MFSEDTRTRGLAPHVDEYIAVAAQSRRFGCCPPRMESNHLGADQNPRYGHLVRQLEEFTPERDNFIRLSGELNWHGPAPAARLRLRDERAGRRGRADRRRRLERAPPLLRWKPTGALGHGRPRSGPRRA